MYESSVHETPRARVGEGPACVGCGVQVVSVGRYMDAQFVSNSRRLAQLCWVCFRSRMTVLAEHEKEAANKKEESDDD